MRIKTKIAFGVGFFFVLLLVITALAIWSLNRLRTDAAEVLKDNYLSLTYVETMRDAMDREGGSAADALTAFEKALGLQENNITEVGEGEVTGRLRQSFEQFKKNRTEELAADMRNQLFQISQFNLQAITRKNDLVTATSKDIIGWLSIISAILIVISFSLILNFPGYIADPIAQLTASIRKIADKNYGERLHFKSNDEFGEVAAAFNEMAERLDAYEHSNIAQLVFEKKRMETLIANLNDAVIGLDEKNRVIFANPVACSLLGLAENSLVGRYAPDIALNNDLMRSILQVPSTQPLKIYSDGKEGYFNQENIVVAVTHNRELREAGRVLLLKNVTPYKELDLAKTNFIATISHELKTPLAAIKMSLKLLDDHRIGLLNPEQQKLVGQIRNDSDRLLRLTGELLDLAQVETGNLRLTQTATAPGSLLDYAVQAVAAACAEKQLKIDLQTEPGLPELVLDPEKTAWVLVNLFSNAIKHSTEGASIEARVFRHNQEIWFTVRDFGKGIEKKYQSRLFDRYFQAPANGPHDKSGTGLGLAISKSFIEAQGGRIWLESEPGAGSLFGFALPVSE